MAYRGGAGFKSDSDAQAPSARVRTSDYAISQPKGGGSGYSANGGDKKVASPASAPRGDGARGAAAADAKDGEDDLVARVASKLQLEGSWTNLDFSEIEVGERIGGGGVGVVYEGWFRGEQVALKTLFDPRVDEKLKEEYMDELLVMSQLDHPNIVAFKGACMAPPDLCFVMERCETSLFTLLHYSGTAELSTYERARMAADVAAAMAYLHARRPCLLYTSPSPRDS